MVSYSASTDLKTKTVLFSGIILDYQVAFTGRSSMLTLSGILAHCGDSTLNYIFTKANIEWVGGDDLDNNIVDGKESSWINQNLDNEDICAIIVGQKKSDKRVYYNPGRIFKRIIHKYNGDLVGTTKMEINSADNSNFQTNDIEEIVWKYFRNHGFSSLATAGIMGNIKAESGFNPARLQSGGPAAGLCQWESYTAKDGRWKALYNYATSQGKNWTDIQVQCDFILNGSSELNYCLRNYTGKSLQYYYMGGVRGNPYNYPMKIDLDYFKTKVNMTEAVKIFMQCYERPSDLVYNKSIGKYYYQPSLNKRISYATEYLNKFGAETNSNALPIDNKIRISVTQNNWRYWRNWIFQSR